MGITNDELSWAEDGKLIPKLPYGYGIVCDVCYCPFPNQDVCQYDLTCEQCGAFSHIPLDTRLISDWKPPRKNKQYWGEQESWWRKTQRRLGI